MAKLVYYAVKIRWNDGSHETFRYETEQQARDAAHYQFVENWMETKYAYYAGWRINWRWPLDLILGR